ncbi:hypothetical protein PHLGIDRAFT_14861 [Phlebiopsis gigantea 11061_1 CR5-6]|uniref:Uncharacterized protein n=1 Tax=Phlebiopsis gigantea (strain 11061_1 CR5-6) TaxID=745531 RepID=A0A0C3S7Z1_PHLG1|nr:hypothetical protein PHLGIDRAFT_14861 [Phlebiopsis gigantea 11061_1 CR5-6]
MYFFPYEVKILQSHPKMSSGALWLVGPTVIPGMILENHHNGDYGRGLGIRAYLGYGLAALDPGKPRDDESWTAMLENGLTLSLVECVLDKYVFGFTKEELIDLPENTEHSLPYIEMLFRGMADLGGFLLDSQARQSGYGTWHAALHAPDDAPASHRGDLLYRSSRRQWVLRKDSLEVAKYAGPSDDEGPSGSLALCALGDCACHYHRPIHPTRVCHGCYNVAYGNVKCPKRDWDEQHREPILILAVLDLANASVNGPFQYLTTFCAKGTRRRRYRALEDLELLPAFKLRRQNEHLSDNIPIP